MFCAMGTQWHASALGGLVGMRYEALPAVWQGLDIAADQVPEVFDDLRVMERAALEALREKHA